MQILPTDSATRTVRIAAPPSEVLATIREVESEVRWVPEILQAEVLEESGTDHLPTTAHLRATALGCVRRFHRADVHRRVRQPWHGAQQM